MPTERELIEHSAHETPDHEHGDHHDAHASHSGHDAHAGHDGHDAHAGHGGHGDHAAMFRTRFWVCLVLTIPALVFSTGLQGILGLPGPRFPGSEYIPAVVGVAIFVYGGWVFLRGAVDELRARRPGMMALIALAVIVAFGYSLAVTLGLPGMDFWWELATLVTIMLLGHWIEMRATMGAADALGELAALLPDRAELVTDDGTREVDRSELSAGDRVMVRPGSTVPADGEVVDGSSDVDRSLLTGESVPVDVGVGDAVVGGSVNGSGALTVRVTRIGDDSALGGIMRLVREAQESRSGAQRLADRAAAALFYVSTIAAVITLAVWIPLRGDDPAFVLERVVTVLVIACPHALGLAIPLVVQLTTSIGAKRGILIRDRTAFEQARRIDVVVFDKTGTLTEGRQSVSALHPVSGVVEGRMLLLAAAAEQGSEHPIGRAIVAAARDRGARIPEVAGFRAIAGGGVEATVDGRTVVVGTGRLLAERGIDAPEVHDAAATTVHVAELDGDHGGRALGSIAVADVVRPESADAVRALRDRGIRVAMLTGDSRGVAESIASSLGIDEVLAEVLPGDKSAEIERLQSGGARVAMVGDGVNDAPALARADVGIAIGAGTDVAIESADVVLATSDPRAVADAIVLSRASYRKTVQNLFWATGYNALGIPLAAGALAWAGILLPPWLGAILMSVSTVVVALNAQLLRRVRLGG